MAAKVSSGTTINGAILFQDNLDPSQFYYVPTSGVPNSTTLQSFETSYWGISKDHFDIYPNTQQVCKSLGCLMSGVSAFDIDAPVRQAAIARIISDYGVTSPKLLPARLTSTTVKPFFGKNTLGFTDKSDVTFPDEVSFGMPFGWQIGTGSTTFAQIASQFEVAGNGVQANPHFGLNIEGDFEVVGDPWQVDIDINLSEVYQYIRQQLSAEAKFGWFTIGQSTYEKVIINTQKNFSATMIVSQGSLDTKQFGAQIFDFGKQLFDQINKQAAAGEGFFKFDPNPSPPAGTPAQGSGSWWPFSVSVNGSYSEQAVSKSARWKTSVQYIGRFYIRIPSSLILAVKCDASTQAFFQDLDDASTPCIVQTKIDSLNTRLKAEFDAQRKFIKILNDKLLNGTIGLEVYNLLYKQATTFGVDDSADLYGSIMRTAKLRK